MIKTDRILIVKLGAIGDVIHALPALRTLRKNFPKAYIAWIVEEKAALILKGNPDLNELIVIDTKKWRKDIGLKTIKDIKGLLSSLRKKRFDLAIDLQGLIKSGLITYLSGAENRIGYGYPYLRERLSGLFTNIKVCPLESERHVIDIALSLLSPLKITKIDKEARFNIPEEDEAYIDTFIREKGLNKGKDLVIINPGAGWKTKLWGTANYAALADMIAAKNKADIVITWGPGEEEMATEVKSKMTEKGIISPPTTLPSFISLLKRCNLFVGADTGPIHLAAALGKRCVGIYGPSDPSRNGPYGEGHRVVYKKMECGNCYKRECDDLSCMQTITPADVYREVEALLKEIRDDHR
ncbi:MAG: lipopolysaccharide heptosyltransferase I [Nitrospinota bacterium]